jgi:hypothetical protein
MRCMACGAEMILMNVVQDDTMAVPGFEHHTFMCSACHDVERRLVFTRHGRQSDAEPMPMNTAPPIVPASTVQDVPASAVQDVPASTVQDVSVPSPAPGLFRRVVAKIRGW